MRSVEKITIEPGKHGREIDIKFQLTENFAQIVSMNVNDLAVLATIIDEYFEAEKA